MLSGGKTGQGIREKKESAILTKRTFSISAFFGRSLVLLWFLSRLKGSNDYSVFGLLHGVDIQGTREGNLKKSTFE